MTPQVTQTTYNRPMSPKEWQDKIRIECRQQASLTSNPYLYNEEQDHTQGFTDQKPLKNYSLISKLTRAKAINEGIKLSIINLNEIKKKARNKAMKKAIRILKNMKAITILKNKKAMKVIKEINK